MAWFDEILQTYFGFFPKDIWALIGAFVAPIVVIANTINPIISLGRNIGSFFSKKKSTEDASEIPQRQIDVLRDVWLKDRNPDEIHEYSLNYRNIKVISIINMKGGVGKTTITANLGAALSAAGKRVLFIDYDYQATLSTMVSGSLGISRREIGYSSYTTLYEEATERPESVAYNLTDSLVGCGLLGASYQLFRDEMEQFARWSSGDSEYDVRTQLRNFLETEFVATNYDIVLIDCGPRFTTSTINALCASTHFLVPTISDGASVMAVRFLDKELSSHVAELFPNLNLLGIIPTFVVRDPNPLGNPSFNTYESSQIDTLERRFEYFSSVNPVLKSCRVARKAEISRLADRIAYYESTYAKIAFDRIARTTLERLGQ